MKKLFFLIVALTIISFETNAQVGQVQFLENSTNCDVTIRPFCLRTQYSPNDPCSYQWTNWSNGSPSMTFGPFTAWRIGDMGIYHQSCDPMTDLVFYQICWSSPNCENSTIQNCTYTINMAAGQFVTCPLPLNLGQNIQYLPPCEDCCPNGAKVYWVGDNIHIDCL